MSTRPEEDPVVQRLGSEVNHQVDWLVQEFCDKLYRYMERIEATPEQVLQAIKLYGWVDLDESWQEWISDDD